MITNIEVEKLEEVQRLKMNAPKGKIPAFFKVFTPEVCSQKMPIPSAFTSYMKGKLPETTTFLRNRRGTIWRVDVIRQGHDFYFEEGWVRFVKDNDVELGDLIVFQFSEKIFYDFKHFDKTACEKETIRSFNFTVKQDESEEAEGNEIKEDDANDEDEDDYEEEDDDEEEDDEEDEDYEEEENILVKKIKMIIPKEEAKSSSSCYQKPGSSTYRGKGKADVKHEAALLDSFKRDGYKGQKRGADILESGLISQPVNAYFVAHLRRRKGNLFIPLKLIKEHKLKIPEKISIIGEDRKEFISTVVTWEDGRTSATDGWRAFCQWNFVKEDEICLCEFVTDQELLVRILHYHAGKWMPRQRNWNLLELPT